MCTEIWSSMAPSSVQIWDDPRQDLGWYRPGTAGPWRQFPRVIGHHVGFLQSNFKDCLELISAAIHLSFVWG